MQTVGATKQIIDKYNSIGEYKFYHFLLSSGVKKLVKIKEKDYIGFSPELEYLEYANNFLYLYRREDKEAYIEISRVFRKAAHSIYRCMLKKELTPRNAKFLNLVSNGSH